MIYFTSDLHIQHVRILELMPTRPWETLEDMNQGLIKNFNQMIGHDDFVIFLGDVVMGHKYTTIPKYLSLLHGRKVLVMGNHDLAFLDPRPGKEEDGEQQYINAGFTKVYRGQVQLEKILLECNEPIPYDLSHVMVSHFPFAGTADHDNYEARYADYMVEDKGQYLFSGHTHQLIPVTRNRNINVGVDAWNFFPVALDTLMLTVNSYAQTNE